MKKVLALVLFFLGSLHLVISQENSNQEKFNNLVSGKWQIETVSIDNEVIDVADEGHWMVFHENGLYQILLDNEEQIGTWKLDEENYIKFDFE